MLVQHPSCAMVASHYVISSGGLGNRYQTRTLYKQCAEYRVSHVNHTTYSAVLDVLHHQRAGRVWLMLHGFVFSAGLATPLHHQLQKKGLVHCRCSNYSPEIPGNVNILHCGYVPLVSPASPFIVKGLAGETRCTHTIGMVSAMRYIMQRDRLSSPSLRWLYHSDPPLSYIHGAPSMTLGLLTRRFIPGPLASVSGVTKEGPGTVWPTYCFCTVHVSSQLLLTTVGVEVTTGYNLKHEP